MTSDKITEHILVVLASIALCAGGVYFCHRITTEWVIDRPLDSRRALP